MLAPLARAEPSCDEVTQVVDTVTRDPFDPWREYLLEDLCLGDFYFSDRTNPGSHILGPTPLPAEFACAQWVRTPNDDKNETGLALVELVLNQAARVFIGFDDRAAAAPDWITTQFSDTGQAIDITETGTQESFDVWEATFGPGSVFLGGNMAAGSSFPAGASNYVIFALPAATDGDADGDGVADQDDNCPLDFNPDQDDLEQDPNTSIEPSEPQPDGVGFACDNCPGTGDPDNPLPDARNHNAAQTDIDGDGISERILEEAGKRVTTTWTATASTTPWTAAPTATPARSRRCRSGRWVWTTRGSITSRSTWTRFRIAAS